MSFDFKGEKRDFHVNDYEWPVCLRLATAFGWKAMGTSDPRYCDPAGWDGDLSASGYIVNECQLVRTDDALRMASALSLALEAAKTKDHHLTPKQREVLQQVKECRYEPYIQAYSGEDALAKVEIARAGKGYVSPSRLRAIAEFCSEGSFRIT